MDETATETAKETAREIGISFDSLIGELSEKLVGWAETIITMLPNLVLSILVLIATAIVASGGRRALAGALARVSTDPQLAYLATLAAQLVVWLTGLFMALGILQLDKTVTSLLAGVGILGLALGFAFQEIAADYLSGVMLSLRRPFRPGDLVEVAERCGIIDDVDLRVTRMRQLSGEVVRLPNKLVFGSVIVNLSQAPARRVDIEIGVSYGSDLRQVRDVTREAVLGVGARLQDRDVEVFYTGFGDSSIDLVARFWVPSRSQREWLAARSEAIVAVKEAYDAADITIPFPIRTLDFGIVGGVPLSRMLQHRGARIEGGEAAK